MEFTYRILFNGQILPGHDAGEVRRKLAELFRIDSPEKIDALFSGKPVSLRKGLAASELPRYLSRLEQIGLVVRSEQELAAGAAAPLGLQPAPPPLPMGAGPETEPAPSAPAGVEHVTCPNCSEYQPKRTLCRTCGTDIPRMLAARVQAKEEARSAPAATQTAASGRPEKYYGEPLQADGFDALLFGFGFKHRINRVGYLALNLLCITLVLVSTALSFRLLSVWPMIIGSIASVFFLLRGTALRLHDIDQSGWYSPICFVPYLNLVLFLLLVVMRGSDDNNRFGHQPRARGAALPVIAFITVIAGAFTMGRDFALQAPLLMQEFRRGEFGLSGPRVEHTGRDEVILYTVKDDGRCTAKALQLHEAGIAFVERNVEADNAAYDEWIAHARSAGLDGQEMAFPVVYVNGHLLPDDPSMSVIRRYLHDNRT
ncbi:DUF805 domain-containing protein [Niveibacterium sp. SC-1]|uniref:DUF805 domain-containing protein n=1 Tax=Niveibacterium sp. SC-1 TaxID=3135646 RepID=UPI00311E2E85